jgi:hypothetical protein
MAELKQGRKVPKTRARGVPKIRAELKPEGDIEIRAELIPARESYRKSGLNRNPRTKYQKQV